MIERTELEAAIAALDTQRNLLGDQVIDTTLAVLRQQLAQSELPDWPHIAMTAERKQVTVMFADISGFTAMSEKLDPEEVRNLINTCFDHLGAVINHYEGHIDKFIGDEIMALFGAPIAHENDPERALRAALDMMTALENFNRQHAHQIPKPLALHFGINTGLVIAGVIGTQDRRDYSVMGDTVNLAARLEGLSETGDILVGEDTYRLTAPLFDFEAMPPVMVKGKEKPVQTYRVLRARSVQDQMRGIEGLSSPLVGRKSELAHLKEAVNRLFEAKGSVVTILGDAGLGKSRLIREIFEADETHRITWVRGRALSYGQSASYMVARDLFFNLFNISLETPLSEAGMGFEAAVRAITSKVA
jgi:class 3 adenylate cyclase